MLERLTRKRFAEGEEKTPLERSSGRVNWPLGQKATSDGGGVGWAGKMKGFSYTNQLDQELLRHFMIA